MLKIIPSIITKILIFKSLIIVICFTSTTNLYQARNIIQLPREKIHCSKLHPKTGHTYIRKVNYQQRNKRAVRHFVVWQRQRLENVVSRREDERAWQTVAIRSTGARKVHSCGRCNRLCWWRF